MLEINGLRLLTDPTFDPAGSEYPRGPVVLRKTAGPPVAPKICSPLTQFCSATINTPTPDGFGSERSRTKRTQLELLGAHA
jgi:hypothetical protein